MDISTWFEFFRLIADVALTGGLVYFAYVTIRESRRWTSIEYNEKKLEKLYSPALQVIQRHKGQLFQPQFDFVADNRVKTYTAWDEIDAIMKYHRHLASSELREVYGAASRAGKDDDPQVNAFCDRVESEWKVINDAHEKLIGHWSWPWRIIHRVFPP